MKQKVKIFAVSGVKSAGKTTLIKKIVKTLNELNYKVGVIKQDDDYELGEENPSIEELIALQQDVDIIILEGMKYSSFPKIEVVRSQISEESICNPETLLAIATDSKIEVEKIPVVNMGDLPSIMQIVKTYIEN